MRRLLVKVVVGGFAFVFAVLLCNSFVALLYWLIT